MRRIEDLLTTTAVALVLSTLSQILPPAFGKIASIFFAAFLPGYIITCAIFPDRKKIDTIERLALSLAFSTVFLAIVGAILKFGLGIKINEITIQPYVAYLMVPLTIIAIVRRERADEPYLPPTSDQIKEIIGWYEMSKVERVATVVLTIALIAAILGVLYIIVTPKQAEKFTEFYILGPNGKAADYPTDLYAGENASVIIGIVNHEERVVKYIVEIWLVNASYVNNRTIVHHMYFFDRFNVTLKPVPVNVEGNWTPEWQMRYNFTITRPGKYKMWFLLFKDKEPPLPKPPKRWEDYANTSAVKRIIEAVNGKIQSLNLNIVVRRV